MGPDMQYVGQKPLDPLTLDIYPAGEGAFTLLDVRESPLAPPAAGGESLDVVAAPVEVSYRLNREELTLHLDGYRGLNLPRNVLDKIYHANFERIYGATPAPLNHEAALAELEQGAGTQFDPEVVAAFMRAWQSSDLASLLACEGCHH